MGWGRPYRWLFVPITHKRANMALWQLKTSPERTTMMYYSQKNNNKTELPTTPSLVLFNLPPPTSWPPSRRSPPGGRVRHWDVLYRYRVKSSQSIEQQSVCKESNGNRGGKKRVVQQPATPSPTQLQEIIFAVCSVRLNASVQLAANATYLWRHQCIVKHELFGAVNAMKWDSDLVLGLFQSGFSFIKISSQRSSSNY